MPLPPHTRLGRYEILSQVGAGGMGEVYRARDGRLGRDVAVKVLPEAIAADPEAASRFAREARAVAALSHPNVLALFDVGEQDGTSFVVTELLYGETLRHRITDGPVPVRAAIDWAIQIAHGLAAAHDKGIIHRDLKPENLFVTRDGGLKVLDFGLALQVILPEGSPDVTRLDDGYTSPGTVLGTVGYMSPEQARGQVVDHRADIFALGAIIFEMLSGRRAFQGRTSADTIAATVRDDPPELQGLNPSVPPGLVRIVQRCLAKDPAGRFHSSHDLALALDALSHDKGAPLASDSRPVLGGAAAAEKALVVLPFQNMSSDPDNEYFADGLTEEIISDLSRIHGLRVISRTSAMQLKGRTGSLREIVRELDVRYVLEGSVRRAGNRLRISAQLIDAATDTNLWSEKYNGMIEDVFDIQERVARTIAAELRIKLTPEESGAIALRPITDPVVYECYLRARAGVTMFTREGLRTAITEVDQGLAVAGENVLLLSVKGEAAWQLFNIGIATDRAQLDEVLAIARRIEGLQPGSPHGDRLRGLVCGHTGDLARAAQHLRRAFEADPGDTLAMGIYVMAVLYLGRVDLARPVAARLVQINPLGVLSAAFHGWSEFMAGEFETAARVLSRGYEADPLNASAWMYAWSLAAAGRVAEAQTVAAVVATSDDQTAWFVQMLSWALRGEGGKVRASLTNERRAWASTDPMYALLVAECHALAGLSDAAFEWLEQVLRLNGVPLAFISAIDPFLANARVDPRWGPFITRMRAEWERIQV